MNFYSLVLLQHTVCELKRNISFIQYDSDSRHMGESTAMAQKEEIAYFRMGTES